VNESREEWCSHCCSPANFVTFPQIAALAEIDAAAN